MRSVLKVTIENKTTSVTTHFKEINKEKRVYWLIYCVKWLSHPAEVALASCTDVCGRTARHHTHCQEHIDVRPAAWERHVHRALHVAPKQPGLESSRLRCLGCTTWWSINVDDSRQSTSWSRQSSLSGANYCRVSSIAQLVSGVAGLTGSSRSKANKLNIWYKNCSMCVTLDNNWDNQHVVPCC